ncbi:FRG domain-containing protein [Marinobacter hydrocarbonoclasticus]|uniref:FRG domain-containing protein n=1 Tax=Marinobacter nauticus TaxID=2743 RepID=UPI001A8DDD24|nr:FRG domain-containing protein [Marinobacter nauticus]MBN8239283.1 FRG domain-containing protein [Marinobacter nauticus]
MAEPKKHTPNNLGEYINTVSDFRKGRKKIWLRGLSDQSHKLIPSLFRRKGLNASDFTKLEKDLLVRFKDRSLPYIKNTPADDWGWLFFMQHYGVPTRLLDWSENPLVALFFATKYAKKNNRNNYRSEAVVWMVDPDKWNNETLEFQSYSGGVLNTDEDQLRGFKPPADLESIPQYCLSLYGAHNSSRIVAQRGSFFIFGHHSHPMEDIYKSYTKTDCLQKIVIEKDRIEDICKELLDSGITESVIFPDLEGLAHEIKREFGF